MSRSTCRTLDSHGLTSLPPGELDDLTPALTTVLPVRRGARLVRIAPVAPATSLSRSPAARRARRPSRLSPRLWVACCAWTRTSRVLRRGHRRSGARLGGRRRGRMFRSPTVFEDVVKTICTTNCAWSATVRMVSALVVSLRGTGRRLERRAFPTPASMAEADEPFYRDVVRAGYRGACHLRRLAADVAEGRLDLEAWADVPPEELPDEELERALLALPGVGPCAAAHVMLPCSAAARAWCSTPWTRPTYARVSGGKPVPDERIVRRFGATDAGRGSLSGWSSPATGCRRARRPPRPAA